MPILFRTTGTLRAPEFFVRSGGRLRTHEMPIACAILERPDGLVLIDTGWSREQCAFPDENPGTLTRLALGMHVRAEDSLASQMISLGYDAANVRHVIATHLHEDHVGGVVDFPAARLHTTEPEWAARARGLRGGYHTRPPAFAERVETHALSGPSALGFPASHDLFGDGSVLLLDARGHTAGSVAVAVKLAERWLIHAGDACMFREQYAESASPTLYARLVGHDLADQKITYGALRAAETQHGATVVSSHDASVFATLPTTLETAWPTAWDGPRKKSGGAATKNPPRRAEQN